MHPVSPTGMGLQWATRFGQCHAQTAGEGAHARVCSLRHRFHIPYLARAVIVALAGSLGVVLALVLSLLPSPSLSSLILHPALGGGVSSKWVILMKKGNTPGPECGRTTLRPCSLFSCHGRPRLGPGPRLRRSYGCHGGKRRRVERMLLFKFRLT